MQILYQIFIFFYGIAIRVFSIFNAKAKAWLSGRESWYESLKIWRSSDQGKGYLLWVHVASYGEFEQGKPVVEVLREKYPKYLLLLSFYSPSGYEAFKNSPLVDKVIYLPLDTRKNSRKIVHVLQPSAVLFVRYEFWFNLLGCLHSKKVPVLYFSSSFRGKQWFFSWAWTRQQLKQCAAILVRDQKSEAILKQHEINNAIVAGDTRMDTVLNNKETSFFHPFLEQCVEDTKVLVAGSTWEEDVALLKEWYTKQDEVKVLVVAPHELDEAHLESVKTAFSKVYTYEESLNIPSGMLQEKIVVLVDRMGVLKMLYRYADIAYVGGGFGNGIHNILEAMVYGTPVMFGPKHQKFAEATDAMEMGVAMEVKDVKSMKEAVDALMLEEQKGVHADKIQSYFQTYAGSTEKVLHSLQQVLK